MTPSDDPTAAHPNRPPADEATAMGSAAGAAAAGPVPARLGKYRVLGRLGEGGMGAVYRAEDPVLGRAVALKAMLPRLAADPAARARFLREARAQAAVEHDHVVPIFDVVDDGPAPFIAMPLLKGMTLADVLRLHPRPPLAEVVRIGREMAEGLAAAHGTGLVHRDIKPANVWLEAPRRRVKLLDFGLARGVGDADAPTAVTHAALSGVSVTATGAVMGTPLYMSPEQARGRKLDARTDLFSLGAVLYEMLTGERAFAAPTAAAVLRKVVAHHPDGMARLDPPAPPRLTALVSRLLAKVPAERPGSAADVAAELDAIAADLAPHVTVHLVDGPARPNPFADLDVTEADAPPTTTGVARRATRTSVGVLAAGAAALVVGVFLAVALIARARLAVLVVEADPPGLEVVVKRGGEVMAGPTADRRFDVPPGAYTVEPADPKVRAKVDPARVEVRAGATERVTIWEVKPAAKTPAKGKADPTPADPDVAAAELLHPLATLTLRLADNSVTKIGPKLALPAGPFRVVEISLAEDVFLDRETISRLLPAVERLSALEVWLIYGWPDHLPVTESDIERLAQAPCGRTLVTLGLLAPLTPRTAAAVLRMPQLRWVKFDARTADDECLAQLARLPNIEELWLSNLGRSGRLTQAGWATLVKIPAQGLLLRNAEGLASEVCRQIAGMPRLNQLQLLETGFELGELATNKSLSTLRLFGMPVTDDDVAPLAKLSSLRWVTLTGSQVTRPGIRKLAAALPGCRIEGPGVVIEPRETTVKYPVDLSHPNVVRGVAFFPDGRLVWSDGTGFYFWDPERRENSLEFGPFASGTRDTHFVVAPPGDPGVGRRLYFAGGEGFVQTNFYSTGQACWFSSKDESSVHQAPATAVAVLPGTMSVATTCALAGPELKVWDIEGRQPVRTVDSPGLVGLAGRPGAPPELAGGTTNGKLVVWETKDWTRRSPAASPDPLDKALAYSPDGRLLATALRGGRVRVWDANKLTQLRDLPGHPGGTNGVAFAPGGKVLATVGADKLARLWDATTGDPLHTFEGHTAAVRCVAVSPDGRLVATGADDKTSRLWEVPPAVRRLILAPAEPAGQK